MPPSSNPSSLSPSSITRKPAWSFGPPTACSHSQQGRLRHWPLFLQRNSLFKSPARLCLLPWARVMDGGNYGQCASLRAPQPRCWRPSVGLVNYGVEGRGWEAQCPGLGRPRKLSIEPWKWSGSSALQRGLAWLGPYSGALSLHSHALPVQGTSRLWGAPTGFECLPYGQEFELWSWAAWLQPLSLSSVSWVRLARTSSLCPSFLICTMGTKMEGPLSWSCCEGRIP